MRISHDLRRSLPPSGEPFAASPPRGHRAAGLIIGALILMAAFIVAAPYLSSALKAGQSLISGQSTTGFPTTNHTSSTTGLSTATVQCSSAISVGNLVAPDIGGNGSAAIAYPSDYCTLAAYALQLINADRAANGTGPVVLGYNQAAQQHSDSMLYYGYFSHFDTQGYKPYMRYTLLGGRGADFENVASSTFGPFVSDSAVEGGIRQLEELMVHNDSACCSNGHRYNILDSLHNVVSIGVAYNNNVVYFDEEFENEYMNLNLTVTSSTAANPYYVTMKGTTLQQVTSPTAIYVAYDQPPAAETTTQLNGGPREYTPGTLLGGVLPPNFFGGCGQFTSGTTVCADRWQFGGGTVDIAFSLAQFVKSSGPGVYTVYLVTGTDTNSAITTVSTFIT